MRLFQLVAFVMLVDSLAHSSLVSACMLVVTVLIVGINVYGAWMDHMTKGRESARR